MKAALLLLTLTLGTNAFAHGITPSEMYTLVTLATTIAPTEATAQLSTPARKIITQVEEFNQTGELSLELQQAVSIIQEEDKTLSIQDALDLLVVKAEYVLNASK